MTRTAVNPETGEVLALSAEGQWQPARTAQNPTTGARLFFDGAAWQPMPVPASERPTMAGSAVRGVTRGVTFGFADEIAGLASGAYNAVAGDGFTPGYERGRDASRRVAALDDATNPGSAIAGQLLGGAATLPVGVVGRAAQGATRVAQVLRSGAARGVIAGATGGALSGFGDADGGIEARLSGAATGGALGGAAGGVLGAGVSAIGPFAGRLLDGVGMRNAGTAADRQILRALSRDEVNPAALAGRVDTPNPTALVDVGGRNLANLGGVAAQTPGRAVAVADEFVQARRGARPDRIASAVDDGFGGGGGTRVVDEVDALRNQRSTAAAPLYDQAFQANAPDTPELRAIMNMPIVQQAQDASLGFQRMAAQGADIQPNQMQMLDAAKRGLDERIGATLDPVTNRITPGRGEESRALTQLRDGLVQQLDAVPEYAAARAAWAGPTQSMDALAAGQRTMRMNPDAVDALVARTSPGNQDFLRLGAGRAVTDMARDPRGASAAARRLLEDRHMQRRIDALIPDQSRREGFNGAMRREVDYAAVENTVNPRGGSPTARLLAGGQDMANDPQGGASAALLADRPMWRTALHNLYRRSQGINSSTADEMAQRLFSTDTDRNQRIVEALMGRLQTDTMNQQQRAALGAAIMRSMGGASGQQNN